MFALVVQPDGSRMLLPDWMLREEATHFVIQPGFPCFPLAVLAALEREVESALSWLPGSTPPGDSDETHLPTRSIRASRASSSDPDPHGNRAPGIDPEPWETAGSGHDRGEDGTGGAGR